MEMNYTFAFAALEPDEQFCLKVNEYKTVIGNIAGPQKYLQDPPHATVFLGAFDDPITLIGGLKELAKKHSAPSVKISGWHVFFKDQLTGGNTLVCKIHDDDLLKLRELQKNTTNYLSPKRNVEISSQRYLGENNTLSSEQKMCVKNYGFPFMGEGWIPHITLASIAVGVWANVWKALADKPPLGMITFPYLCWYRLKGDVPVLIERIPFAAVEKS